MRERLGPDAAERLLRRLRVLVMQGGLLDDPELIAGATQEARLRPADISGGDAALEADAEAARTPARAARALDHKLVGPPGGRRYTAPS